MTINHKIILNDHNTHLLTHTMKSFNPSRPLVNVIHKVIHNVSAKSIKLPPHTGSRHTPRNSLNIPSRQRNPHLK